MARIEEGLGELGFWRQKARYDGADFDLAHFRPVGVGLAGPDVSVPGTVSR
jgi:hypothetical protein